MPKLRIFRPPEVKVPKWNFRCSKNFLDLISYSYSPLNSVNFKWSLANIGQRLVGQTNGQSFPKHKGSPLCFQHGLPLCTNCAFGPLLPKKAKIPNFDLNFDPLNVDQY